MLTLTLIACSNEKETSSSSSDVETEQTSTETRKENQFLRVGESHVYDDSYNGGEYSGLKMTVDKAEIDKNIQLGQDGSSINYDGYVPVRVEVTYENTSDKTIDLISTDIIDSTGATGLQVYYVEGVTSNIPDVLTAGQKVKITEVFAIKNEGQFDITYCGKTWRVN